MEWHRKQQGKLDGIYLLSESLEYQQENESLNEGFKGDKQLLSLVKKVVNDHPVASAKEIVQIMFNDPKLHGRVQGRQSEIIDCLKYIWGYTDESLEEALPSELRRK